MSAERCPFVPGDVVVYAPSERGYYLDVNAPDHARLTRGEKYRIARVENDRYVVVDGYDHPGGGIYWTEFSPSDDAS